MRHTFVSSFRSRRFCSYAEDIQKVSEKHQFYRYRLYRLSQSQIKPASFYEAQAHKRMYYYHIDLQGRLYIEDMLPKSITTSLKSPKFLNFFWKRLRPNESAESKNDYPFISPCGTEMNFVRPADTPIVFDRLESVDGEDLLVYNANTYETFNPNGLVWKTKTNRIYHPVLKHSNLSPTLGLIKSHLAITLSEGFSYEDSGLYIEWKGTKYLIQTSDN